MAAVVHPPRRPKMTSIAELTLDTEDADGGVRARLHAPTRQSDAGAWVCRFEIEGGIEAALDVEGESSLQALALALTGLSAVLYGSDLYRSGRLGLYRDFGGYLGVPAPSVFLDEAPYPF